MQEPDVYHQHKKNHILAIWQCKKRHKTVADAVLWGAVGCNQCSACQEGLHSQIGSHEAGVAHGTTDLGTVQVSEKSLGWNGRQLVKIASSKIQFNCTKQDNMQVAWVFNAAPDLWDGLNWAQILKHPKTLLQLSNLWCSVQTVQESKLGEWQGMTEVNLQVLSIVRQRSVLYVGYAHRWPLSPARPLYLGVDAIARSHVRKGTRSHLQERDRHQSRQRGKSHWCAGLRWVSLGLVQPLNCWSGSWKSTSRLQP